MNHAGVKKRRRAALEVTGLGKERDRRELSKRGSNDEKID